MRQFIFAIITIIASFSACELALHALTKPSYYSPVSLLGIDLPPYRIVLDTDFDKDVNNHPSKGGKGLSDKITRGDLQGMIREDDVLGYTTAENQTSVAGWAHSNNIGANSSIPTSPNVPQGKKRILIFGESFSRGCGIPQNESWSALWQDRKPNLDIVNMGVSGYSMAMASKRFEITQSKIDYDTVAFMFLPDADTWRDINTMRQLGEGWGSFTIMPRYKVVENKLEWIAGPYHPGTSIFQENTPEHTTPLVTEHLKQYDDFYTPLLYESPPLIGSLITYKIIARLVGERMKQRLYLRQRRPQWNSEGMEVEKRIFQSAKDLAITKGKKFVLILLPAPDLLEAFRGEHGHKQDPLTLKSWNELASGFNNMGIRTIDLLPGLLQEKESPDRAADEGHYGVKTNAVLSRLIESQL